MSYTMCPAVLRFSRYMWLVFYALFFLFFCTRWFKYDRDYLYVNKSQFVPVIFEPPCIFRFFKSWPRDSKLVDVPVVVVRIPQFEKPWGGHVIHQCSFPWSFWTSVQSRSVVLCGDFRSLSSKMTLIRCKKHDILMTSWNEDEYTRTDYFLMIVTSVLWLPLWI
jgi:hypothetical protein